MPFNPVLHQASFAQDAKEKKEPKAKKPASAGLKAWHARQKKCGAEWREAKAAGKIEKNQTWPKYLSECNKRLKATST
jgi:hypothetical protein